MTSRKILSSLSIILLIIVLSKQQANLCVGLVPNGRLQGNQQCDAGTTTKLGCGSDCIVDVGFRCTKNPNDRSDCGTFCGDFVRAGVQQCDNGNRSGCINCVLDPRYTCRPSGSGTVCSLCGNGILQFNQQCDNGNQTGCINCTKQAGFTCIGNSPSLCYVQGAKSCGNGIVQLAQPCDDGNVVDGDGCNSKCYVQQGFKCTSAFNTKSACSKLGPTCGDGKYEPLLQSITDNYNMYGFNAYDPSGPTYNPATGDFGWDSYHKGEFCDNGNKVGCINCLVQPGYTCKNQIGKLSVCTPVTVVAPTCGNGVHQAALGEACDDGNVRNGDGCDMFCKEQSGWSCKDPLRCLPLRFIGPQSCGDGVLKQAEFQTCDDGNKVNGDGCNDKCQVQSGFSCPPAQGQKTVCTKLVDTFCGNGIVEGYEQCDNGWPVGLNGCSTNCRIYAGWQCYVIKYSGPSFCWKERT